MSAVNRYLEDKAMDDIDVALGRPVDPMSEGFKNCGFVIADNADLLREMSLSPHWDRTGVRMRDGEYFIVTGEGRRALATYLKANRRWIVAFDGEDWPIVAPNAAKARHFVWRWLSYSDESPMFTRFERESRVRAA